MKRVENQPQAGSAYIYGRRPVLEWLESGLPVKALLVAQDAGGKPLKEILHLAEQQRIPIRQVEARRLDLLAQTDKHQGILAETALPSYATLEDALARARERNEPPLLAVLDGVQDPHNLGAVLRTADAAGVHGVVIPKDQAVGLTPTVVKASAGAAAFTPLLQETNLTRFLQELKKEGFWVTGTAEDGDRPFDQADFRGKTVIVLGSEGKGMRRLVREQCDFIVRIPMFGRVASLNVSVAAALLFYEARRQRTAF